MCSYLPNSGKCDDARKYSLFYSFDIYHTLYDYGDAEIR